MRSWASGGRSRYRQRRSRPARSQAGAVAGRHPDVGVQIEAVQLWLARPAGAHGQRAGGLPQPPHQASELLPVRMAHSVGGVGVQIERAI